jgi:hypothetical protein
MLVLYFERAHGRALGFGRVGEWRVVGLCVGVGLLRVVEIVAHFEGFSGLSAKSVV